MNYADFQNKEQSKFFTAGLFFALGLILVVSVIFTLGSGKGFAQQKFHISVLFREIGGLVEGAPVRLLGVTVGSVSEIDFLDQDVEGRRVKVELAIFSKYRKQLERNAVFSIETEGILGEKLIEITTHEGEGTVDLNKLVIGNDPFQVQDLVAVFANAAESFTTTAKGLSEVDIKRLTDVMIESSNALVETSQGLDSMLKDVRKTIRKSSRLLDRVEQKVIDGTLFKVF